MLYIVFPGKQTLNGKTSVHAFYWEESRFGKRKILGCGKVIIKIQLATWVVVKLAQSFRVVLS